ILALACIALGAAAWAHAGFGSQAADDPAGAGERPALQKAAPQERAPQTLTGPADAPPTDFDRLQGAWQSVSVLDNGKPVVHPIKLVIEGDQVRYPSTDIRDGISRLMASKTPKEIYFFALSGPNTGRNYEGIYKFDGEDLV